MKAKFNFIEHRNGYDIYEVRASYATYFTAVMHGHDPDVYAENDEDRLCDIQEWCDNH